jgi:methylmalonyl-CoA mutase cobalamin-binding subunit
MFGEWYQKTNKTEDTKAAIQERVTAVLWSIPKEAFADSFQKLYERCQQCVVKDDDYFEGQ